ncbi:tryptophan synthase beta subunit-like PLP-dependent enzyme, partial [Violaceomyces palustris]
SSSSSGQLNSAKDAQTFHKEVLPGYRPTRLIPIELETKSTSALPSSRFQGRCFIKAEDDRFGLPAFKVLGASWASFLALCDLLECQPERTSLEELRRLASGLELVAATDGNHGCAVAWFASLLGIRSQIFTPSSVSQNSIDQIRSMGEKVSVNRLATDYDRAVLHAASHARDSLCRVLVQDTAWEGYTLTPHRIVDGYSTIFSEVDEALGGKAPTHVIVPVGVGSLAQSVVRHYSTKRSTTEIISVEPETAACLYTSLLSGENIPIQTGETVMPGLNCGTVSSIAWPELLRGVLAAVKVRDCDVLETVNQLEAKDVRAGPCGAAPLAALSILLQNPNVAQNLGLLDDPDVTVVLLMTEG